MPGHPVGYTFDYQLDRSLTYHAIPLPDLVLNIVSFLDPSKRGSDRFDVHSPSQLSYTFRQQLDERLLLTLQKNEGDIHCSLSGAYVQCA